MNLKKYHNKFIKMNFSEVNYIFFSNLNNNILNFKIELFEYSILKTNSEGELNNNKIQFLKKIRNFLMKNLVNIEKIDLEIV